MKKALSFVFFCILAVGLVGCGSSEGGQTDEKSVAILTPYLSSVTTNSMVEELEAQAENQGWDTNVIDTKGDIGQLSSRMDDVITKGVDAMVVVSINPSQVKQKIQKAADEGISVFGCDSGYIEGMVMNATSDNEKMSEMITGHLFEQMGENSNLVVLTHRPHPGVSKRTDVLDQKLESSSVNVVAEQHVEVPGPINSAKTQMENLLLSNQEEGSITAVWAGWDEPAIGAAQAIQSAERENIVVTGIDGTSQALNMIADGSPLVATVKQNFTGMAEIVSEQMANVFAGDDVESEEMYAPATLITQENVDEYLPDEE